MNNHDVAAPLWHKAADWIGPLCVAIFGVAMTAWLWGRVGEILLDFGRELYVSWQLSRGKHLYQDIDYHFGPLAAYANALWMWIFGPGVRTVLVANLLVLIAISTLLYRLLLTMADPLSAATAMIVFLALFGLGIGDWETNANFLSPYNHGATYGLLTCFGALVFVTRFCRRGHTREAALVGVCIGLSFLTKPEICLACAAGAGGGLIAAAVSMRYRLRRTVLTAGMGFLLPIAVALVALSCLMPWKTALAGMLNGWLLIGNPTVSTEAFYRHVMGTDHIPHNALRMCLSAGGYVISIAALSAVSILVRRRRILAVVAAIVVAGLVADGVAVAHWNDHHIHDSAEYGLPLALAAIVLFAAWRLREIRKDLAMDRRLVLRFSFAVFSFVLLFKIILNSRTSYYGFVLAAPAAMSAIIALMYLIPRWLARFDASGVFFRIVIAGFLLGLLIYRLHFSAAVLHSRTATANLALGGTVYLPAPDAAAGAMIRKIMQTTDPSATLIAFPDATGLNFAAARASTIRYTVFNPFEVKLTGEPEILRAMKAAPPDFVVVVATDMSEFGVSSFGQDYAVAIDRWVRKNYEMVAMVPKTIGDPEIRQLVLYRRMERAH